MHSLKAAFAGIAVVGLIAGCTATTGGTGPSRPAPALPHSFAELEARLLTHVPAGYEVQPDGVYNTGPSTLAKAVLDDGRDDADHALESEGFVRSYTRLWMNENNDLIRVFVYQFQTSSGAQASYHRMDVMLGAENPAVRRFVVPGLSVAFGGVGPSDTGHLAAVVATTGPFVTELVCDAKAQDGLIERVSDLAREQVARL